MLWSEAIYVMKFWSEAERLNDGMMQTQMVTPTEPRDIVDNMNNHLDFINLLLLYIVHSGENQTQDQKT